MRVMEDINSRAAAKQSTRVKGKIISSNAKQTTNKLSLN